MRKLFEGTEEQFKNLQAAMDNCDNELPTIREDVYTENVWSIRDVLERYRCTKESAMEALNDCLGGNYMIESINEQISYVAENNGYPYREEGDEPYNEELEDRLITLYNEAEALRKMFVQAGGDVYQNQNAYDYLDYDLDVVLVDYFGWCDGDQQQRIAQEEKLTVAEMIDMLETRINNTK